MCVQLTFEFPLLQKQTGENSTMFSTRKTTLKEVSLFLTRI